MQSRLAPPPSPAAYEPLLRSIALAAMVAYPLLHLLMAPPHLFADGVNFFLMMLSKQEFAAWDKPRLFSQLLTQWPVVLALRSGVRSVSALGTIYSGSLLLLPASLWFAAALIQRRTEHFWRVALAYSIVFVPSSLFAIGEFNLCYALNALVLSLLLVKRPTLGQAISLALLAVANLRTYEANLLLAPIVIGLLASKLIAPSKDRAEADGESPGKRAQWLRRTCLLIALLAYSSAFLIGLLSVLFPRDPANANSAKNPRHLLVYLPFLIGGVLPEMIRRARSQATLALALGSMAAYLALFPFLMRWIATSPGVAYDIRTPVIAGLVFCLVLQPRWPLPPEGSAVARRSRLYQSSFSLLLVLLFGAAGLLRAHGFQQWLAAYRQELAQITVSTPIDQTGLAHNRFSYFAWGWNNPPLSRVLNPLASHLILNDSRSRGWEPERLTLPVRGEGAFRP